MANYYTILGVDCDASSEKIKRAYRGKAKKLHPDIDSAPAAKSRFQQLNEAYQVLSNEESRRIYDIRLRYGAPAPRVYYQNGNPSRSRHDRRYHYRSNIRGDEEEVQGFFEKIFDQFLYVFMLCAGLFALAFGISRLWSEPIYGVNPYIGILFGTLLTGLLLWGWHERKKRTD